MCLPSRTSELCACLADQLSAEHLPCRPAAALEIQPQNASCSEARTKEEKLAAHLLWYGISNGAPHSSADAQPKQSVVACLECHGVGQPQARAFADRVASNDFRHTAPLEMQPRKLSALAKELLGCKSTPIAHVSPQQLAAFRPSLRKKSETAKLLHEL